MRPVHGIEAVEGGDLPALVRVAFQILAGGRCDGGTRIVDIGLGFSKTVGPLYQPVHVVVLIRGDIPFNVSERQQIPILVVGVKRGPPSRVRRRSDAVGVVVPKG